MRYIEFDGVHAEERVVATIENNKSGGVDVFLNGVKVPNLLNYRVILSGTIPTIELSVAINELDGSAILKKILPRQ
jgi:hypothetical protein